jgi:AraC family transcriptional regulator, transcriptional activator of pobA
VEILPIYGITEFSREKNTFYSNDLHTHLKSHHFINRPHKHSTYISVLFTKGSGEHQIDFDTFPVKPGSVFMLNPGQVHSWKLSNYSDGYVFFHSKEFYDGLFANRKIEEFPFFYLRQNNPVIYLVGARLEKIESLFKEVNDEFKSDQPYRLGKLGSLVDLIYIELSRSYQAKGALKNPHSNYLKVKKLQKLIDENFKEKKFPAEYADLMNMSTRHLSRICQETLKKSTSDLIIDRIIMEAKRMLIHSDITISQLADELHYEDHSYFGRLFKKEVGLTPKTFRSEMMKPVK